MSQVWSNKTFIFNNKIDREFMYSLYDTDYPYISGVFESSLESLENGVGELEKGLAANDIQALRKTAHRIKPVLGFTGLLEHQKQIADFEKTCEKNPDAESLGRAYASLVDNLSDGIRIIREEGKRLKAFLS